MEAGRKLRLKSRSQGYLNIFSHPKEKKIDEFIFTGKTLGQGSSKSRMSGQKGRENTWKNKFQVQKSFILKLSALRANALQKKKVPKSCKSEVELIGDY